MKVVVASGRFKKDLKRYRHKPETLEKLYEVVSIFGKRGKSSKALQSTYANWRI